MQTKNSELDLSLPGRMMNLYPELYSTENMTYSITQRHRHDPNDVGVTSIRVCGRLYSTRLRSGWKMYS